MTAYQFHNTQHRAHVVWEAFTGSHDAIGFFPCMPLNPYVFTNCSIHFSLRLLTSEPLPPNTLNHELLKNREFISLIHLCCLYLAQSMADIRGADAIHVFQLMCDIIPKKLFNMIWQMETSQKEMKMKDGEAFLGTPWIDLICKNQLQSWVKGGRLGFSSLWGDEHDVFPSLRKWFP